MEIKLIFTRKVWPRFESDFFGTLKWFILFNQPFLHDVF